MGQSVYYDVQHSLVHKTHSTHISNYGVYLFLLYGGLIAMLIGAIVGGITADMEMEGNEEVGYLFLGIGILAYLVAAIYFMVLLYQVWRFVITELRSDNIVPSIETPGKAIGYCFIPIYSLYWAFRAFGSLPNDINLLAQRRKVNDRTSGGLGIAIPVLAIVGILPVVNYVVAILGDFILRPIFITQSVNLCKNIRENGVVYRESIENVESLENVEEVEIVEGLENVESVESVESVDSIAY